MPLIGPVDPLRAVGAVRSTGARLLRSARADHATLNERSMRSYSGVMTHAFLHAAVAPSRRIRPGDIDCFAEYASALAASLGLPSVPYLAGANQHRFAEEDDIGSQARSLLVTRSGVLEMLWALEQIPTADGAWAVQAVEAGAHLPRFVGVVRSDDYGLLLGNSRWSRRLHSRVDWSLGITPTTAGNTGQRGRRDILVAGPSPDRASGHVFGFMPPLGYGANELCGVKRSLSAEHVVEIMLEQWLHANGYLRAAQAVQRTAHEAIAASASSPQALIEPAATRLQLPRG